MAQRPRSETNPTPITEPLWKLEDLAAFLGLTLDGARALWKTRQIPEECAVRLGIRRLRFNPERVRQWIKTEARES